MLSGAGFSLLRVTLSEMRNVIASIYRLFRYSGEGMPLQSLEFFLLRPLFQLIKNFFPDYIPLFNIISRIIILKKYNL
jgi:hypothetical protein